MASITNHTQGMRGIRMKDGSTVWVEPGASADIDKSKAIAIPDMGSEPSSKSADSASTKELKAQVASLTKQVADLTAERDGLASDKDALTKQVADLTASKS
ncbi:hypothetical protein [Novosphingobium sp. MBES04]|uniref:hypothetical protein n=1 Tax=Novosphingobium sp. MBES04 TaxID=1206458 RepID=UPI00057C96BB|nr:hypothetical protein [Novosphingobium sp. MBES04]GAM06332.1 hypothetical conserved protein [Novosphingobium sp. MBES04]